MPTARLDEIEEVTTSGTASLDDIETVVERKPDPKPPSLPFLPKLPKAPIPSGLNRGLMDDAVAVQMRQIEPAIETGKQVAKFSQAGATEAKEGFGQLTGSGKSIPERAKGAHRMFVGGAQAASPALAVPAAVALARTPVPFLASIAGGAAAQYGVEKGAKALGVPEGVAELAGDVAGIPGYTGAIGAGARALRGLPWLKNAPKQAAESAAEVLARETIPAVSPAKESAKTFQAMPAPKSAEESAKVFDKSLSTREAQAAAKAKKKAVQVPEEGVPEEIARLEDSRQRVSKQTTGKPYEQLADTEKQVVDDLVAESAANQGAREPKGPPPISSRRLERNQRGALSIPSKAEIKSGVNEALLKIEETFADRYARIRDLEKAANIPPEESAFVGARQFKGHAGKIQDKLIDLRRVLRPAKKDGFLDDAIEYAKLERHEERFNADPQNYVIEGGKTIQDVLANKAGIEAKLGSGGMQKVNAFNMQLRDYSDSLLQELRDSGIISKDSYDAIKAANQKYIPFQRVEYMKELLDADKIPAGSNALSVASQDVVHSLTGSEKEIFDPIQSIVRNTYRIKALVERNEVAKKMAAHAQRPEFKGVVIELKPGQKVAGGSFEPISYMEDGITKQVAVPKGVGAAMKHLNKDEVDAITRAMGFWGNALRTGVTLDPVFMAGNVIRDYQTATAAAKLHGLGFTPLDWGYGLLSAVTRGIPDNVFPKMAQKAGAGEKTYREFLRSGGAFGGFYHHGNLPQTASSLTQPTGVKVLKTIVNPAELMRTIGETMELAPRLGTFRKAMKQGKGLPEAGWTARQATVDFERRGAAMRAASMWVPFLNARLQGTLNLKRAVQEAPMATAFRLGAVAGLPAAAAYFHNRLNFPEEYDSVADFEKRGNFMVIYGKGRDKDGNLTDVIKMPKGEVGPIVNTVEDMLDYWYGKDQKSWRKKAVEFVNNMSPVEFAEEGDLSGRKVLSSLAPPVIKAAIETTQGKSLYTGRDIVPRKIQQPSTPSKQYTTETPLPFIKTAGALSNVGIDVSPMAIEHSMGTLFGHLGRRAAQASPTEETWKSFKEGKGPLLGLRMSKVGTGMEKRFVGANAQSQSSKDFESLKENQVAYNDRANAVERAVDSAMAKVDALPVEQRQTALIPTLKESFDALRSEYSKEDPRKLAEVFEAELKAAAEDRAVGGEDLAPESRPPLTPFEKSLKRKPTEIRAKEFLDKLQRVPEPDAKRALIRRYVDRKIITPKVEEEILRLHQQQ